MLNLKPQDTQDFCQYHQIYPTRILKRVSERSRSDDAIQAKMTNKSSVIPS